MKDLKCVCLFLFLSRVFSTIFYQFQHDWKRKKIISRKVVSLRDPKNKNF